MSRRSDCQIPLGLLKPRSSLEYVIHCPDSLHRTVSLFAIAPSGIISSSAMVIVDRMLSSGCQCQRVFLLSSHLVTSGTASTPPFHNSFRISIASRVSKSTPCCLAYSLVRCFCSLDCPSSCQMARLGAEGCASRKNDSKASTEVASDTQRIARLIL